VFISTLDLFRLLKESTWDLQKLVVCLSLLNLDVLNRIVVRRRHCVHFTPFDLAALGPDCGVTAHFIVLLLVGQRFNICHNQLKHLRIRSGVLTIQALVKVVQEGLHEVLQRVDARVRLRHQVRELIEFFLKGGRVEKFDCLETNVDAGCVASAD